MNMRLLSPVLFAVVLSACVGTPPRQAETSHFDLGPTTLAWKPDALALRGVGVFAPSWLGTPALHYRLLYAEPLRRHSYADSRWTAPPGELLERALNRQTGNSASGCRLRVDLDELSQVFDTPQSSRSVLEARASLMAPNHDAILARQSFALVQPAPSADARGGVAAAVVAVAALGSEMNVWLTKLAQSQPALAARCKGEAP
jgi:cholesterol transport system auxiliary component